MTRTNADRPYRTRPVARLLIGLMISALPAGAALADSPAADAESVRQAAWSQFTSGRDAQAKGLFEQYVSKYRTHEGVPEAYLYLGYSCLKLEDEKGFNDAMDDCIRQYYGSVGWFGCHYMRMRHLRDANNRDEVVRTFELMLRRTRGICPLDMPTYYTDTWRNRQIEWDRDFGRDGWGSVEDMSALPRGEFWEGILIWAGDDETRANRLLRALHRTFDHYEGSLPPEWQYVHYRLTQAAGRKDQAEELFESYLAGWGDDLRAHRLRLRMLHDWKFLGVEFPQAEDVWKRLKEEYVRYNIHYDPQDNDPDWVYDFLSKLHDTDDWEAFSELIVPYVTWHPFGRRKGWAVEKLVKLGGAKIDDEYPRIARALELLEQIPVHQVGQRVQRMQTVGEFHLKVGQIEPAVKIAEKMLQDLWCADSWKWVERRARNHEPFKPLLAQAREKWQFEEIADDSPARKDLDDLKQRLKDGQDRHAEEIADKLYKQHGKDPATAEAIYEMVRYYYRRIEADKRDKWARRMAQRFPHHLRTQSVLDMQISAAKAAQQPDQAGPWLQTLAINFPGAQDDKWVENQIWRFAGAKDSAGRWRFAQDYWGPLAKAGDAKAMAEIMEEELLFKDLEEDRAKRADFWLDKADKHKGTYFEPWCLHRAWRAAYHRWSGERTELDLAAKTIDRMLRQKVDPEKPWKMRYWKVNLYSHVEDGLKAQKEMERIVGKGNERTPGLRSLVHLPNLGAVIGATGNLREGAALAEKLKKMAPGPLDQDAINMMLASMYDKAREGKLAAQHKIQIIEDAPFPARLGGLMRGVLHDLADAKINFAGTGNKFVRMVDDAVNVAPTILETMGRLYLRHNPRSVTGIRSQLASKYPHSRARQDLDDAIKRYIERQRQND